MSVSSRHLLQQRATLAALARTAGRALTGLVAAAAPQPPRLPGPEFSAVSPPLPADLLRDYIEHVGGEPAAYAGLVPPHLFPQWTFPLVARTLDGLPYPMLRVVNGGCRLRVERPIPAGVELRSVARLQSIDDDGRRAVLQQHVTTGPVGEAPALVADLYVIVPLRGASEKSAPGDSKDSKPARPTVPVEAEEYASWSLGADAGLDFAKLTGDINPIHWLPAYARMSGFRSVILHGFATMARTWEGLARRAGAAPLQELDVRFTRPLVLPARVGLYVAGNDVWVADAPGGAPYLTGTFRRAA